MSNSTQHSATPSRTKVIGFWAIKIIVSVIFIIAGSAKLAGMPQMIQVFDSIALGQWFRYVTGAIEVGGGLLVLAPKTTSYGAGLLSCTMIGAVLTHLFIIGGSPALEVILLFASLFILYATRGQILKLFDK